MGKKRIARFALLLLAAALLFCGGRALVRRQAQARQIREAEALTEAGDYETAAGRWRLLGEEEKAREAEQAARERDFQNAKACVGQGDYESARRLLLPLRDEPGAEALLRDCDFLEAQALLAAGELPEARRAFLALGDAPGAAEALAETERRLYDRGWELARAFRLEDAIAAWECLGEEKDCAALVERARRELAASRAPESERLLTEARRFRNALWYDTYDLGPAYLVVSESLDENARFLFYYPGGYDGEIYIDYFYYYLMNPVPNCLALVLKQNGYYAIREKNAEALELMLRAAAECGVFFDRPAVAGSSLGVYPAIDQILYGAEHGLKSDCLISLDAGAEWQQPDVVPGPEDFRVLAEMGCPLYLFSGAWVGVETPAIRHMLEAGCTVARFACENDEHDQITLDAMGNGVLHWLLGPRSSPCPVPGYTFERLKLEE